MLNHFSHVQVFAILWTVALQAPPSMGFSRNPPPGDHPDPEIKLTSLMCPALAGRFLITNSTWIASIEFKNNKTECFLVMVKICNS